MIEFQTALLLLQALLPFLNKQSFTTLQKQKLPDRVEKLLINNSSESFHPRIWYGAPASIEDFPYFASLSNCGATIISDTWIVTAAHCVEDLYYSKEDNYVWVGGETFNNSIKVPFDEVVVHPFYHTIDGTPMNDIALIKLTNRLQFSKKIQPLSLPKDNYSNVFANMINWLLNHHSLWWWYHDSEESYYSDSEESYDDDGIYYIDDVNVLVGRGMDETGRLSESIKQMELNRFPSSLCYNLMYPSLYSYIIPVLPVLDAFTMCGVRVKNLPGADHGDSGSPVVKDDTLQGIISYGFHDDDRVVFLVKVASYVSWIKSVTDL